VIRPRAQLGVAEEHGGLIGYSRGEEKAVDNDGQLTEEVYMSVKELPLNGYGRPVPVRVKPEARKYIKYRVRVAVLLILTYLTPRQLKLALRDQVPGRLLSKTGPRLTVSVRNCVGVLQVADVRITLKDIIDVLELIRRICVVVVKEGYDITAGLLKAAEVHASLILAIAVDISPAHLLYKAVYIRVLKVLNDYDLILVFGQRLSFEAK